MLSGRGDKARQRLQGLLAGRLQEEQDSATHWISEHESCESRLEKLERRLCAVPDEESLSLQLKQRVAAREELARAETDLKHTEAQVEEHKRKRDALSAKLDDLLRTQKVAGLATEENERFLRHSERVRTTLARFRESVVQKHAERLEGLFLSGYRTLLRKRRQILRLRVGPRDCSIELFNGTDSALPPDRLSAGERQLLAVALLWGLARASGRSLPVVIDTPLGRLDTSHRTNLVERYLPRASHQVLVLSTNEEIDRRFLKSLAPAIGWSYRIEHDDAAGASAIEPGYFWEVDG